MLILKIFVFLFLSLAFDALFSERVWAWGPAVHMVIAFRMLDHVGALLPAVAGLLQGFPLEYLYGSLAADFFVGKGQRRKEGHSHNWETGLMLLQRARGDKELAYAYGFLSHLAEDVVAHNYFVPNLIGQVSTWNRWGHLYWEIRADHLAGPTYLRAAREILDMDGLGCDDLLRLAARRKGRGIKARRRLFTQSVKLSGYLCSTPPMALVRTRARYRISPAYLSFMIDLSFRLAKDFLIHPDSSPCLSYDPIGSDNLHLSGRHALLSKVFGFPRPRSRFAVDPELLEI